MDRETGGGRDGLESRAGSRLSRRDVFVRGLSPSPSRVACQAVHSGGAGPDRWPSGNPYGRTVLAPRVAGRCRALLIQRAGGGVRDVALARPLFEGARGRTATFALGRVAP